MCLGIFKSANESVRSQQKEKTVDLLCDAQLQLMEEMVLHPVIDSKYLLTVKEGSKIENVQPAIVAHVIHSMEAYDLYEYELPSSR